MEYVTLIQNVKLAAEKVVAARRRDALGVTADESILLARLKEGRKRTLKEIKERVTEIVNFKPDPCPVAPSMSTCACVTGIVRCSP